MDFHDHWNHNGPTHKSSSLVIGKLFYFAKLFLLLLLLLCEIKDLIQESVVAENSYAFMFLMAEIRAN